MEIEDLPDSILRSYTALRKLPDGRICGVHRLMYHWTMHVDIDLSGYNNRYCFATEDMAVRAMAEWDGIGDPGTEWHRHPETGRRRNPATGEIYVAW